ncbi:MAG: tetratricopeptide repeat protein [Bryobacteraceae bacterium]|nr:tetratricopeptide repeat protein [Bryobacteraceae bacterium]
MTSLPADPWLWILDDALVRSLLAAAPSHQGLNARAAAHPSLAEAMRCWLRGEGPAALAALEPALAAEDADALMLGAQICFESGDLDRAASLYGRLAAVVPEHPYAAFNEGLCRARLGQWPEAAAALQRAVVLLPSHAEAWHALGVSLLHVRRPAEASSAFGHCMTLRPGYVPAICGQAAALQMLGRPAEALSLYLPLLESAPNREEILANALQAALAAQSWAEVRRLAARIAATSPGSLLAREAAAHADAAEHRYEAALAAFREVAAAAPALLEPWYNAGVCLHHLGRHEEAAQAFEAALQVDPRHAESRLGLAESLLLSGRLDRARAVLESLAETPVAGSAWLRLGLIHALENRLDEARDALRRALELGIPDEDPQLAELRSAIALRLHEAGDYAAAAELYALSLAVLGSEPRLRLSYGNALASLGRLEEAQEAWAAAISGEPALAAELVAALDARSARNPQAPAAG